MEMIKNNMIDRAIGQSSLIGTLQHCRKAKDQTHAIRLLALLRQQQLDTHTDLGNHLVPMLVDCGCLPDAQHTFDKLSYRNEHSWSSLISGYASSGELQQAFHLYQKMQEDYIKPNSYTHVALLSACAKLSDIERGRQILIDITNKGLQIDLFMGSTLLNMYVKSGQKRCLSDAQHFFDRLVDRNEYSWCSLMLGYIDHGEVQHAFSLYQKMLANSMQPNACTFVALLKACTRMKNVVKGHGLHTQILKMGLEKDLFIGSTILDMYSKCSWVGEARHVFDKSCLRDTVSWNALITGYAEHSLGEEAIRCYEKMQLAGACSDDVTFSSTLKACVAIGGLETALQIYDEITRRGFEIDPFVASSMIDLYSNFGLLREAEDVFRKLPCKDVVSWTAMIKGYGENHEGNMTARCFTEMQLQGVKPNGITFTCLLSACSHGNLVAEGQEYFKIMRAEYGIDPTLDHIVCMVDLLGRSGNVHEAERFAKSMNDAVSMEVLTALLNGCKLHGEVELGVRCFQQLVQVNEDDAAAYLLMIDIYKSAGRLNDANMIEGMMRKARAQKKPACALLQADKRLYEFDAGDNNSKDASAMLESLRACMKDEGYVPISSWC